jgi:tripeptidyl-peptidase I
VKRRPSIAQLSRHSRLRESREEGLFILATYQLYSDMARFLSFAAILASFVNSSNGDGFLRKARQFPSLNNFREEGIHKSTSTHVFMESIAQLSSRDDISKQGLVSDDHVHQVVFVVQQKNMEELTRILHDVSDPSSINYGQHMTKEQVGTMTHNAEAREAIVKFINANGATLVSETLSSEYMIASAPISVWTRALNTEFFTFHQTHYDGTVEKVVRAERYWIPRELDEHVESVLNTVQMPLQSFGSLPTRQKSPIHTAGFDFTSKITPQKLRSYYNVGESKGSAASTQGIFATIGQYFSPSDLRYFFNTMGLPDQPVASSTGNHTSDSKCIADNTACSEANLDVQYIMAASPGSPTHYMYTDKTFSQWLVTVANMTKPPLVLSISYGAEESGMQYSDMMAFDTEAKKMGVIGITIVVASGDDGAVTRKTRTSGSSTCAYSPFFPASSPYVVSVGATSVSER